MKILQINAVYKYGSTGRTCYEMDVELNRKGHISRTIYGVGKKAAYPYGIMINSRYGAKFHSVLSRLSGLQGYFSRYSTKRILKFISEYNPDILHLRNLHSNFINTNMLLKYLAENDIATVITLHDCWIYTGKCTHYTVDGCYKWQDKCGNCPKLKKDNVSWFFDRTGKMLADKKIKFLDIPRLGVVGVSNWITDEAKKSILKNATVIKTVYNWIDMKKFMNYDDTQFYSTKLGICDKFVIISVAAVWSNRKGLDKVIELSKKIKKDEVILLVGKVPEGMVFPSNIITFGETESVEELAKLYCVSDCYISFSKEETFGKTVAEAQACGIPAVVYNSTALPELVENGCGYVINNDDELNDAIAIIRENGKDFYKSNCINNVQKNFEMGKNIDKYIEIYSHLIKLSEV